MGWLWETTVAQMRDRLSEGPVFEQAPRTDRELCKYLGERAFLAHPV